MQDILANTDLYELLKNRKKEYDTASSRKKVLKKTIKLIEYYIRQGIKPENTILNYLPVLPPDFRPIHLMDRDQNFRAHHVMDKDPEFRSLDIRNVYGSEIKQHTINNIYKIIIFINGIIGHEIGEFQKHNFQYDSRLCKLSRSLQIYVDLLLDAHMTKFMPEELEKNNRSNTYIKYINTNTSSLLLSRGFWKKHGEIEFSTPLRCAYKSILDSNNALIKINSSLSRISSDEDLYNNYFKILRALCIKPLSIDSWSYLYKVAAENNASKVIEKILDAAQNLSLIAQPEMRKEMFAVHKKRQYTIPGEELFSIYIRPVDGFFKLHFIPENFRRYYPITRKTVQKLLAHGEKHTSLFPELKVQYMTENDIECFLEGLHSIFKKIEYNRRRYTLSSKR